MAVNLFCNKPDRSCLEWFTQIILSRMVSDLPVSLNIIYGDENKSVECNSKQINIVIPQKLRNVGEIEKVFDRFYKKDWIKHQDGTFILDIDIVGFTLWMLNREEESLQKNDPQCWDKWGRFKLEETLAYKKGLWQKPVVDIIMLQLLENIETECKILLVNRKPWGLNKPFGIWFTHDVDKLIGKYGVPLRLFTWASFALISLLRGNIKLCRSWFAKMFSILFAKSDSTYDSLFQIAALEKNENIEGMFFFMSLKRGISFVERLRYPIKHAKTRQAIMDLFNSGKNIGLHPGRYKPYYKAHLIKQKEDIEEVLKNSVAVVRNHHLLARYPDSWLLHERSGFKLCSNMGWGSKNGFRAGTGWPYRPFDFERQQSFAIVEVPMIYMDNTSQSAGAIIKEMQCLIGEVLEVYGPESYAYDVLRVMAENGGKNLEIGSDEKVVGVGTTHVAIGKLGFKQKRLAKGIWYYDTNNQLKLFRLNWAGACRNGLINFLPFYDEAGSVLSRGKVGKSDCKITDMRKTLAAEIKLLKEDPSFFMCKSKFCAECQLSWTFSKGNIGQLALILIANKRIRDFKKLVRYITMKKSFQPS